MDARIKEAVSLIRCDGSKSLNVIARSVNLSPSRLRHLFKDQLGVTLTQYVKSQRLECARHLVETTFLSIKQIGDAAGFADCSHFVRDFKRTYGETPTEHRRRHFQH